MQLHNLLIGGFDQVNYQHYCDDNNHCLISKRNCKGCDGHCCYNDNNNNSGGEVQGNHVHSSDESNYYYIFIFQINLNFLLKVLAPESMQETFMSDSEDEGGRFISWNLIFSSWFGIIWKIPFVVDKNCLYFKIPNLLWHLLQSFAQPSPGCR